MNNPQKRVIFTCSLAAIVCLALFLRLHHLGIENFWLDEFRNIRIASQETSIFDIHSYPADIPKINLFLLRLWFLAVPANEWWARLPNAILGGLSVLLFYWLTKLMADRKTAFLSTFLLSINTLHISYSQEAKYYPLMLISAMLIHGYYWMIFRSSGANKKHFLLYTLFGVFGLYVHYYLAFLFVIHLTHAIISERGLVSWIRKLIACQTACLIILIPEIIKIILKPHWAAGTLGWLRPPDLHSFTAIFNSLCAGRSWPYISFTWLSHSIISLFCLSVFLIMITMLMRMKIKNALDRDLFFFLIISTLLPPLAFFAFSHLAFPIFHIRYLLPALLPFLILVARLLVLESNRFLRNTFTLLFLALGLLSLIHYYTVPRYAQIRKAAHYLCRYSSEDDQIVVDDYCDNARLLRYYLTEASCVRTVGSPHCDDNPLRSGRYLITLWEKENESDSFELEKKWHGIRLYKKTD